MMVLVAYATRHGATAGIADRIAAALTATGLSAEARPVEDVKDVGSFDAVVLGGAAYMFHWLKPAVLFSRRYRRQLAARPVWLFSSDPLGTNLVDKVGKNVLEAMTGEISTASTEPASGASASATNPVTAPISTGIGRPSSRDGQQPVEHPVESDRRRDVLMPARNAPVPYPRQRHSAPAFQVSCKLRGATLARP